MQERRTVLAKATKEELIEELEKALSTPIGSMLRGATMEVLKIKRVQRLYDVYTSKPTDDRYKNYRKAYDQLLSEGVINA